MKKEKSFAFGKNIYLLGMDEQGKKYWLEEASWDCNWYYGFGYVETYTNNNNPGASRDIESHQHFDGLFLNKDYNSFKKLLVKTPLNDDEIWKLLELMRTFYILKDYHALIHRGGANYTQNDLYGIIKNDDEFKRLKEEIFPKLFNEIYKLLED